MRVIQTRTPETAWMERPRWTLIEPDSGFPVNSILVWVEVATRNGRQYLKTEADGVEPNNLLALPRCR